MAQTPQQAKRAFLNTVPRMRDEFAQRFAEFRSGPIFNDKNYLRKYPAEVLHMASEEMRARHRAAEDRVRRLLDSGWRPSNPTEVQSVFGDCFGHRDYREDPFSDIYQAARRAYSDVGQPDPPAYSSPDRVIGDVQVRAYNEAVSNLETHLVHDVGGTSTTYINATNIAMLHSMTGGTINQNVGGTFSELLSALENMQAIAVSSSTAAAAVIETSVAAVISELRGPQPNEGKMRRLLSGISAMIQTVGELGPAWALVAAEAARIGWSFPMPPRVH